MTDTNVDSSRSVRRLRRRGLAWGVGDQALSSATNFGGSVLAARALSAEAFGAFAIGFAAYLIVLGISRAWSSDPLLIRFSASDRTEQRAAIRRAAGSSVAIGVTAGALLGAAGVAMGGQLGPVLVALGVSLPFLMLQDLWRFALIMQERQRAAAVNDGVWLGVMLMAFALASMTKLSPWSAMALWACGALAGAIFGLSQLHLRPELGVIRWWRQHRDLSGRYSAEFLLTVGVGYLLTFAVAAVGGLKDSAGLRGAQVLMGPLHVIFMGISIQTVPVMVRQTTAGTDRIRRTARLVSTGLVLVTLVWGMILLAMPDRWGQLLLGETWLVASPLLLPFIWLYSVTAATSGPLSGLRALADARRSLAVRVALSPLTVVLGVLGALLGGPAGAALGLAAAGTVGLTVWWLTFHRSLEMRRAADNPASHQLTSDAWRSA
jgi:O-antigen/teichoic acid export membrane protein